MIVAVPKESAPGERRVALVPDAAKPLAARGIELVVEAGAGGAAGFDHEAYRKAGVRLETDRRALFGKADLVAKVQAPRPLEDGTDEVDLLREGAALVAMLRPLDQPQRAARLATRRITSFALELMPRITRAQSMDVLSSMATVAG